MRILKFSFRGIAVRSAGMFVLLPAFLFAQTDSLHQRSDAIRFVDGVSHTLTSPLRWDHGDWLVLGGLIAGTSALTFVDQPVRDFWQKRDNAFLDGVERVGYHYGKPYSALTITAGFYLSGVLFKNDWARETGMILGSSLLSGTVVMGLLKNGVGRARPGATAENLEFRPFNSEPAFHAFPSGHNSVAFGISLVLAKRVESVPLKVLFYSLAATTAVSRMYTDQHWASDVAFGGMIAWFCADTAINRLQSNRFRRSPAKDVLVWKVYPYPGGVTLTASLR